MQQVEELKRNLAASGYIADTDLASIIHLTQVLQRPLLLEGDAGVGKTAVAVALSQMLQQQLIRLQCYEGLDASTALYEWNYQRQLMAVRLRESEQSNSTDDSALFSEEYLLPRPLLQAIRTPDPCVLLIDEIDRADDEFEAFLLEVLSDFQITIPELGTISAQHRPTVILTSNATRDLSDALRRRCLFHFVDYPDSEKELQILSSQVPDLDTHLARSITRFVQKLRKESLKKTPGVAETLDWAAALMHLQTTKLEHAMPQIEATLGCLLKTQADRELASPEWLQQLLNTESDG
jgi:MoxR-like ATPase